MSTHSPDVADDLALALTLAGEADALTMQRFGAVDLRVETKPDMTPATDADLDAERLLRARLAEHRPDDSVFGEEFGGGLRVVGGRSLCGHLLSLSAPAASLTAFASIAVIASLMWAPTFAMYGSSMA